MNIRLWNEIELRDILTEIIEANKQRGLASRNFNLFPADIKGYSLTEITQWFAMPTVMIEADDKIDETVR